MDHPALIQVKRQRLWSYGAECGTLHPANRKHLKMKMFLRPWQVNEWGENLDELQETYTKRVGLKRASSLNLDMIENSTDSRRRQNSGTSSSLPSTRRTKTHENKNTQKHKRRRAYTSKRTSHMAVVEAFIHQPRNFILRPEHKQVLIANLEPQSWP
jgi:hypothetical protein